jgi:uncharacterized protein (TIGR02996 family)
MSLSDGDGLRAAILAQPDDDTLRLIYADWLQENDQPDRAAFIRAQVAMVQAEPYSPQARAQERIAKKVLDAHPEWYRTVRPWASRPEFVRGFIEHVEVNAATFPGHAAALFAAEPVRSVQVMRYASTTGVVSLAPFFAAPELERVVRLDVTPLQLAPNEFKLITDAPALTNLTDLCLRRIPVPLDWLTEVLIGPALPALAGLDLFEVVHGGPRLSAVLPRIDRRIVRLNVGHVPFTSDHLRPLLASRCLREVEELRLACLPGGTADGPMSHLNLGWVIPWSRLRLLDLNGQRIGDTGVIEIVKELTARKEPAPLRWLGLANNRVTADGIRALVTSDPEKVNLYHLDMQGNGVGLSAKGALGRRFPDAVIEY